jgi:tRNA(fMet)-specific endonuclease VapC
LIYIKEASVTKLATHGMAAACCSSRSRRQRTTGSLRSIDSVMSPFSPIVASRSPRYGRVIEYCLDTNVCIDLIRGKSVPVRRRFKEAIEEGSVLCVSSVVLHELWYGVAKSAARDRDTDRLRAFLSGPFEILHWDDADARAAGEVRAQLEKDGQPIGAYDALIAAQAVRRGITIVTANTREFKRVDGLMWEDWAKK